MLAEMFLTLALTLGAADPVKCVGNRVPPLGYRQYTEVVSGPSGSIASAQAAAREGLIATLCQGLPCRSLAAEVSIWATNQADGYFCAMAVVEEAAVARWRAGLTASDMDAQFEEIAAKLLATTASKPVKVAVVLHKVVDNNTPGGDRAEWLRSHMGAVLSKMPGVAVRPAPASWAGDGVPQGLQAVVTGRVFTRMEGQEELLEVSWRSRLLEKGRVYSERFSPALRIPVSVVPTAVAARTPDLTEELPAHDPALSVQVTSSEAGTLCTGQPTQVYLSSAKDQFVQVYNVYGSKPRKALLVFPNPDQPSGWVKAGARIALGGSCGFQAFPVEGADNEHFIAVAAPSREQFGPLGGLRGPCRLRDAGLITQARGLSPSLHRAGDGYRIGLHQGCVKRLPRAGCQDLSADVATAVVEQALAGLPECVADGPATASDTP